MISLGIDPDVHGCAFAWYEDIDGEVSIRAGVVRQKDGKGRDAAIALVQQAAFTEAVRKWMPTILTVEGQDVRYTGKTSFANPQDICNLSLIAGAALAVSNAPIRYCPYPREWKGNVPKHIQQARILDRLGVEYTMAGGGSPYTVPADFEKYSVGKVNAGDWKDLTDAVGLAVWGMEKYRRGLK